MVCSRTSFPTAILLLVHPPPVSSFLYLGRCPAHHPVVVLFMSTVRDQSPGPGLRSSLLNCPRIVGVSCPYSGHWLGSSRLNPWSPSCSCSCRQCVPDPLYTFFTFSTHIHLPPGQFSVDVSLAPNCSLSRARFLDSTLGLIVTRSLWEGLSAHVWPLEMTLDQFKRDKGG